MRAGMSPLGAASAPQVPRQSCLTLTIFLTLDSLMIVAEPPS